MKKKEICKQFIRQQFVPERRGITLVALVITIIILLILAGITINLTIGENGIIQKAKEAGRNYQNAAEYEKIALDELMNTTDGIIDSTLDNDKKPYDESEFRKLIAQAITKEGVATTWEDSDAVFVENIGKILQERTKDATASLEDIEAGKTAYVNGVKVTGTASKRASISGSFFYAGNGSNYFQIDSIEGYQSVSLKGAYMYAMFFNENGVQIEKVQGGQDYVSFAIPSETAYIRFNVPYYGTGGFTGYYIVE